jgi:ABC-type transport system substrate-binding protein
MLGTHATRVRALERCGKPSKEHLDQGLDLGIAYLRFRAAARGRSARPSPGLQTRPRISQDVIYAAAVPRSTRAEPPRRSRAARAPRIALPLLAVVLLASGCGASLGGRYDSATTAPAAMPPAGATSSVLRVVTAQPLPSLDPAFANTRQSRAVANALCTPLVRYADAAGLPGTVIIPGLARDLPIVSRGSRTFRMQLLAGLHFADGTRLTTQDVRATLERLLDPATRSPGAALFHDIVGARLFADGESPHLRGVRATGGQITITLKRSDPAFLARLAMPIACPVESSTPHREVPGLLARQSTGRYRVVESSPRLIDLKRVSEPSGINDGGTVGAAARISIERLDGVGALEQAIQAGDADLSLDDLPGSSSPALVIPSSALAVMRIDPSRWPLSDESVRRALSLALDRQALAQADGGDVVAARSLLLDPQAPGALPADPATARALLRRAGAERALRLPLWAEPGGQARVARAIADQLAQIGVQIDVHVASASERPSGARAWIEWLDPAYGDPAAVFVPLADALARGPQTAIAKRVRRAARLAGDARRAAFRRLDERLGAGGLGAIPLLRANFSTPISSMLVGRGTHPVFDVDLALLSTH